MAVYLALSAFPVLFGFCFPRLKTSKRQKIVYLAICGLVMWFVMGCRHHLLGSEDTTNYYERMRMAIQSPYWEAFYEPDLYEKGFQYFVFLLSRVFHDPQWLLIITSLIFVVSILYFTYKNSDELPLALATYITLGLMTFHMQGMRQALAMSICLFAYEQAKKKHLLRFILLVLFATLFHQTAIVFFVVYIACQFKLNLKNIVAMLGVSAVAVAFSPFLVDLANRIFEKEYDDIVDSGGFVATAIYVIIFAVSLLYFYKNKKDDRSPLVYVLIIGMATFIMRYVGVRIAERVSYYFAFSQIGLLPLATNLMVKKDRIYVYVAVAILQIALFAYRLHESNLVVYQFFWERSFF